jgi:POT family proton-dependent oligopeptide transporter
MLDLRIFRFNSFWVYLCPLVGAYVADAHLGRYNTILVSIFIALVGHTLLVISAIPPVLANPNGSFACFIVAIIVSCAFFHLWLAASWCSITLLTSLWEQIMGIGTGGFKPNISPLVAEQAETESSTPYIKVHPKSNEKVIVDPGLTAGRIYMYVSPLFHRS